MIETLLKRAARKIHSISKRAGWSRGVEPQFHQVEGVPPGLDYGVLTEMCDSCFGERLAGVSHIHLSSWKSGGAFRLILKMSSGCERSLIYKTVAYRPDDLPGLVGLPVSPGAPEFIVYNDLQKELATYLPEIYFCTEVAHRHYEYLMEDLGDEYQRAAGPAAILTVVAELPNIRKALNRCAPADLDHNLIRYDGEFSKALLEYAHTNLERHVRSTKDKPTLEVIRTWTGIVKTHGDVGLQDMQRSFLIHGDFGSSNILIHKQFPSRIKLIDWEWAGIGVPHADLASLLKPANAEIEECGLRIFSRQDNGLSFDENNRLYQWCKLERGLLDAAFLAAHYDKSSTKTRLNVPAFITQSSERALAAYKVLAG